MRDLYCVHVTKRYGVRLYVIAADTEENALNLAKDWFRVWAKDYYDEDETEEIENYLTMFSFECKHIGTVREEENKILDFDGYFE